MLQLVVALALGLAESTTLAMKLKGPEAVGFDVIPPVAALRVKTRGQSAANDRERVGIHAADSDQTGVIRRPHLPRSHRGARQR